MRGVIFALPWLHYVVSWQEQVDDLTLITLGETDPSIKPNTWPDAHIVWEPNEDRTHANGHLEWPNSEPPEPQKNLPLMSNLSALVLASQAKR